MRVVIAALVAITLPTMAVAQSRGAGRGASHGHSPAVAPWSSMTSTLPPIGLGLPPIGLAPPTPPPFKGQFSGFNRFQKPGHHGFGNVPLSSVVYVVPPFYPAFFPTYSDFFGPPLYAPTPGVVAINEPPPPPPPPAPPPPATGWLRFDLDAPARGSQVFVDGYFVGTLEDVNAQLMLDVGPHAIEVRAPDFKPIIFDVKIVADRAITYRAALESLDGVVRRPPRSAAVPATAPATIYFIPNCYLGNVPPQQATLPGTCDISKLTTYKH